ncbi:hypothetical protein [Roseobacter sp. AzwK-3b]|uniref:hypothetical protein n=1 Tax=Roseobacter sp. AzwK-3b TaxID=351016 RepID=UPI0002F93468|nr:hypothetical protein [Roseobacter sp. AzwK-3b]
MLNGENLTDRYTGYAIYLPSLQKQYAAYPLRPKTSVRGGDLPAKMRLRDLDFFDPKSRFWHCKYVLYSAGQFDSSFISQPDIVSTRDKANTVVIGDSGGYQVATGKLPATRDWIADAERPEIIFKRWISQRSIRDNVLRWLDHYSDFAMTLDMPLFLLKDSSLKSPFSNLSAQQLIDLSVENLRYFADNRGKATGAKAKYLNVLQDVGDGTGDAWYDAVKDFDFEGWAFGGGTRNGIDPVLSWMKKLLDDHKLDKCEWIHILMASPPESAVYYTAIQKALRKATGNENLQVSFDSSSPFQMSGIYQTIAKIPELTADYKTWRIPAVEYPQNPKFTSDSDIRYLQDIVSPITRTISINDFHAKRSGWDVKFFDTFSHQLLTNHNMYVYHRAAVDACDLVFHPEKRDEERIPKVVQDNLSKIEQALC